MRCMSNRCIGNRTTKAETQFMSWKPGKVKDTLTKACLRERILGAAYFNEGVCDVTHNSLQFSTRILVYTIMRPAVTVPHIDWF